MRLPWPFGRRSPFDGPSPASPAEGSGETASSGVASSGVASSGVASSGHAPAPLHGSPTTGAWRTLPPIQRTAGPAPLVAPASTFFDGVPGTHPLPPVVGRLGHDVTATAPPGLVVARAVQVPSLTSATPMPTRPVQRHAANAASPAEEPIDAARDAATAAGEPTVERAASAPAAPLPPVRTLAAVAPSAIVTPAARPLTAAPEIIPSDARAPGGSRGDARATTPSPSGPRTTAGPAAAATSTVPALPPVRPPGAAVRTVSRWSEQASDGAPAGSGAVPPASAVPSSAPGAQRAGSPATAGADTARSGASSVPTTHALPGPRTGPAHQERGPAQRTGEAPATPRRAGLGAPIAAPPRDAIVQRSPVGPLPMRRTPPGVNAAGTAAATRAEYGQRVPTPGTPPAAPSPAASMTAGTRVLPVLPVALHRAPDGGGNSLRGTAAGETIAPVPSPTMSGSEPGSASAATSAGRPGLARVPAPLPTLGFRPLRPAIAAQRVPAGAEDAVSSVTGEGAAAAAQVAARWASSGDLPATVTTLAHAGPSQVADAPLRPLEAGPAGIAGNASPTVPELPREIVFPPRDGPAAPATVPFAGAAARTAGSLPASAPRAAGVTSPAGRPGDAPVAAQRSLSLARPPAQAPQATQPTPKPALQRIVAEAVAASVPAMGAQRPGPAATTPLVGITATPVVQRVDGKAPDAAPGQEGHSEAELDELARALFGRIRGHLRSEVIHEREAKGLTFDAF